MFKWLAAAVAAGAALIALGAAGLLGRAPAVSGDFPSAASNGRPDVNPRTIGVGSCASGGCHGGSALNSLTGNLDDRTWGGSAAHWLAVDPHTKAYAALESPLAKSIMERFAPGTAAAEDLRCVACHTNPALARANVEPHERQLRNEGVSCEACHGDAGRWLPLHTTWTPADRGAGYDSTGMVKLFDLGERALTCAGCHVGAAADGARGFPVRDMNHDMIAAGHPRLNFDFADSQRRLTPHWKEEDASPEFEVKAWLVGRAAHAEASAKLSADRESRGRQGESPWPEFADFSCVSCHHQLGDGYKTATGKPAPPVIWPKNLDRAKWSAASGAKCLAAVESALKSVELAALDCDAAGAVYHGLAARERMRMKRVGKADYDPGFDRLANLLKQPRGSLDFKLSDAARTELGTLLRK